MNITLSSKPIFSPSTATMILSETCSFISIMVCGSMFNNFHLSLFNSRYIKIAQGGQSIITITQTFWKAIYKDATEEKLAKIWREIREQSKKILKVLAK